MFDTRHEKIIITIAAYIIGFTTAFIAYGVTTNTVTKYYGIPAIATHATQKMQSETPVVIVGDDGLHVYTGGTDRLLSVASSFLSASVIATTGTSGVHYAIVDAELSRDANFVYFCEQQTADAKTCTPFIYDIGNDVLHYATLDSQSFYPNVSEHSSYWTPEGVLVVNDYQASSSDTPWDLITE